MTRGTYVYRPNLGMVPKEEAEPFYGAPAYQSDHMNVTWHPANGQMYESKSEFRKATRAAGCRELGDAPLGAKPRLLIKPDRRERAMDIKRSIYDLRNGRG